MTMTPAAMVMAAMAMAMAAMAAVRAAAAAMAAAAMAAAATTGTKGVPPAAGGSPHVGRAAGRRSGTAAVVTIKPSDLATFIYTGGDHRPVEGLHAHATTITRRWPGRSASVGAVRPRTWRGRRCRCTTSTRSPPWWWARCSTAGGRGDLPEVLRLQLLARDEPGRRDRHLDAGDDGLPAGPRRRPSRDAPLGPTRANRTLRLHRCRAPAASRSTR